MKKQAKILVTVLFLVGVFENTYSMFQRFAKFRKNLGNSQFFKRFKTKKQTTKQFHTENIAKTVPKRSKVKTMGIMAGIAAGGYGLYESLKNWFLPREFPTAYDLSRNLDKKDEDPSLRMLVFSGYGSAKEVINKIWRENASTIAKKEAEEKLKNLLLGAELAARSEYVTLYNTKPIQELLTSLYIAELFKKNDKKAELADNDFALKNGNEINKTVYSNGWYLFLLNGNLKGPFEAALNKNAILNDQDRQAIINNVDSLVSMLKIPQKNKENVKKQILNLTEKYGDGKYELISCVPYSKEQTTTKGLEAGRVDRLGFMFKHVFFNDPQFAKIRRDLYFGSFDPQKYENSSIKLEIPKGKLNVGLDVKIEDIHDTKGKFKQFEKELEKILQEAKQ